MCHNYTPPLEDLLEMCPIGLSLYNTKMAGTKCWYAYFGIYSGNGESPREAIEMLLKVIKKK